MEQNGRVGKACIHAGFRWNLLEGKSLLFSVDLTAITVGIEPRTRWRRGATRSPPTTSCRPFAEVMMEYPQIQLTAEQVQEFVRVEETN